MTRRYTNLRLPLPLPSCKFRIALTLELLHADDLVVIADLEQEFLCIVRLCFNAHADCV